MLAQQDHPPVGADRAKRRIGYLGEDENAPTPNIQDLLDKSGDEQSK